MKELLMLIVIVLGLTETCSADPWRDGSAVITCKPNEGYFELLSQQNYFLDFDDEDGEIVGQNVYFPSQLEKQPVTCPLPGHEITVEGRDKINGKGYCGVKSGAQARVLINGKPVAFRFDKVDGSGPSSIRLLQDGWIELSDCYERMHSVTIFSTESSVKVELCRVQNATPDSGQEVMQLAGACKTWPRNDPTFNGQ